jgi:shikimate kinase
MNNADNDLELIKKANNSIERIVFKDGTIYFRMPRGNLVRASKRAYMIRKYPSKK